MVNIAFADTVTSGLKKIKLDTGWPVQKELD